MILLGLSALALDVGVMYTARTSAQRAADAAALAGAFTFVVDPTSPQPDTAAQHARQTALGNRIVGDPIETADVTINVDVANRLVTVDIHRAQNTFLARALGRTVTDINARAIAEASPDATSAYCVKPWFIPNTVLDSVNPPCTACTAANVLISGGEVTALALSRLGQQFTLKPNNPSGQMAPGQFFAIQLPDSVGGSDYRNNIRFCTPAAVGCSDVYSVETGNMVGPTVQGVRAMIGDPPDTYSGIGMYTHADGTTSDTSRSLVVAPIWDTCNMPDFCPDNQFPTGTNVNLQVIGFALIFVEGIQGNDVVARLINVFSCDGAPLETSETGPYAIPVRLVRPSS